MQTVGKPDGFLDNIAGKDLIGVNTEGATISEYNVYRPFCGRKELTVEISSDNEKQKCLSLALVPYLWFCVCLISWYYHMVNHWWECFYNSLDNFHFSFLVMHWFDSPDQKWRPLTHWSMMSRIFNPLNLDCKPLIGRRNSHHVRLCLPSTMGHFSQWKEFSTRMNGSKNACSTVSKRKQLLSPILCGLTAQCMP